MVVVGLNTARKTKDASSTGLNKDTPELEPPFGHLPRPSLVQLFLQAILSPHSPTYSKNLGIFCWSCLLKCSPTPSWILDLIPPSKHQPSHPPHNFTWSS